MRLFWNGEARDGSKKSAVLDLLRPVSKKMKLTVESGRNDQGERVYKVK